MFSGIEAFLLPFETTEPVGVGAWKDGAGTAAKGFPRPRFASADGSTWGTFTWLLSRFALELGRGKGSRWSAVVLGSAEPPFR
jgi:hypothetical protein